MLSQDQINEIELKLKKIPTHDDKKWLTERPWWKNSHVEINQYLQQYFPQTHVVAMPDSESYYINFIKQSKFYIPDNVEFIKMKQSNCHENCAQLLKQNKIESCVFGYALSDDGLFRSHSWGLKDGQIVETTEERLLYFGYII